MSDSPSSVGAAQHRASGVRAHHFHPDTPSPRAALTPGNTQPTLLSETRARIMACNRKLETVLAEQSDFRARYFGEPNAPHAPKTDTMPAAPGVRGLDEEIKYLEQLLDKALEGVGILRDIA